MAGTPSKAYLDLVDDFYFSALYEDKEIYPISDEKYAEELQLQEVLVSSNVSSLQRDVNGNACSETFSWNYNDDESDVCDKEEDHRSAVNKGKKILHEAESSQFFCSICMDGKPSNLIFRAGSCSHSFCVDCMGTYVVARIQENISYIKCPEVKCSAVLEPQTCRSIIPAQVFDRWEDALCESVILGSQKFYCPFKDCSALMVDDGGEVVTISECPSCRRLFCAQCKVSWHSGMDCKGFRREREGKEKDGQLDMMAIKLAEREKWRRCPKCKFYVEKSEGCLHISCRCGFHFCYKCGNGWNGRHYNCNSK